MHLKTPLYIKRVKKKVWNRPTVTYRVASARPKMLSVSLVRLAWREQNEKVDGISILHRQAFDWFSHHLLCSFLQSSFTLFFWLLLQAINEFLDDSVVLPPGALDSKLLSKQLALENPIRRRKKKEDERKLLSKLRLFLFPRLSQPEIPPASPSSHHLPRHHYHCGRIVVHHF